MAGEKREREKRRRKKKKKKKKKRKKKREENRNNTKPYKVRSAINHKKSRYMWNKPKPKQGMK